MIQYTITNMQNTQNSNINNIISNNKDNDKVSDVKNNNYVVVNMHEDEDEECLYQVSDVFDISCSFSPKRYFISNDLEYALYFGFNN